MRVINCNNFNVHYSKIINNNEKINERTIY